MSSKNNSTDAAITELIASMQEASWAIRKLYVEIYELCASLSRDDMAYAKKKWEGLLERGVVDYTWAQAIAIYRGIQKIKNKNNIASTERAAMMYRRNEVCRRQTQIKIME